MKKFWRIVTLALTLCLLAGAVGCNPTGGPGTDEPSPTEEPEPTPVPRSIADQSKLASSIVYANDIANGVQCYYDGPDRKGFFIRNMNAEYYVNFGGGSVGLTEIKTKNGKTLLSGGMTGFVKTVGGREMITVNSPVNCRTNTNRLGYYYYEVNVRDISFASSDDFVLEDEIAVTFGDSQKPTQNMITDVKLSKGTLSAKVSDPSDPYIGIALDVPFGDRDTLIFDLEYQGASSSGAIYYGTSKEPGFSGDRNVSFRFDVSKKKQTVTVELPVKKGSTLSLTNLRFDMDNTKKGETFRISNIRLAKNTVTGDAVLAGFEQTLHAYSDKIQNQIRILYDEQLSNLSEFGYRYDVPKDQVEALLIGTDKGEVTDFAAYDGSPVNYLGFAIKNAGILGFVTSNDGISLTRLTEKDGCYEFELYIDISGSHKKRSYSLFGHRIYTSEENHFDNFRKEAGFERNPLEISVVEMNGKYSKFKAVGYNPCSGSYDFTVEGTGFASAYMKKNNNKYYGGEALISGRSDGRTVYVCSHGANGCLEAAVVLDDQKMLVPILPEVCKNFAGEKEESYYWPSDPEYGDTIIPFKVDTDELKFTMLDIYQKWGQNNLKQISSISFHIGYYHLSTGTTESNCIAPYFVYGRDGWTLPDFRGCSGIMWTTQPQFNSVGRPRFLSYYENGETMLPEYTDANIRSSGPVYADIEYSYLSYDGAMKHTLRHVEFPSTDENRTMYTMTVEFLKDKSFRDARNELTLFSFDGRFEFFRTLSYKAEDGSVKTIDAVKESKDKATLYTLCKDHPYVSCYNYQVTNNDIENFAYLMRDYQVIQGGKALDTNLVFRNSLNGKLNLIEIGLDQGKLDFKAGDTMVFHFILLPFGVKNQTDDDNAKYVIADSIENPWRISDVKIGTLVPDEYLAEVDCLDDEAEFTVTGGRDLCAVRVNGFTKLTRPTIQKLADGQWQDVVYNVEEYDGYQVNYTPDGYFSYSFTVPMENYTDQVTLRISVK